MIKNYDNFSTQNAKFGKNAHFEFSYSFNNE